MTAPTRADVGFRSERGPLLVALMLSLGIVAIDSTIIATAVPSIVKSLGGFAQFPWLFSIYLLAQAVSVPIYGKLSDLYGRKPIMLAGIAIFLAGSVLCGLAWSMPALIAFRAVQGLGAGAVQPMSMTIAADTYSLAERAKVQGYLASVWAISAVVGPTLGGVFAQYLSWRWIFWVNLPLCVVAGAMVVRNLHEDVPRTRHTIDYLGAVLLTSGCTLVILGLLEGGQAWAWTSPAGVGVPLVGAVLVAVFLRVEQHAAEPVLPLWVFGRRIVVASALASLCIGATLIGLTSYVPTYVQGALGTGPLVAGFALATLTIGWPLAATLSGRIYLRIGFKRTALIGIAVLIVSSAATATWGATTPVWVVAANCFFVGLGLGFIASPTLIAAQSSVGWADRGVVTGTSLFARSMGSALGVALFGAIANATLGSGSSHAPAAIAVAAHRVFVAAAVLTLVMAAAVLLMPRRGSDADAGSVPAAP